MSLLPRITTRAARRRGATYTLIVVASSLLIVITAGMLLESSGHALTHSAHQSRAVQAREAAWAGVRWAARDAEQGGPTATKVRIRLHQVDVDVEVKPGPTPEERWVLADAATVDVTASLQVKLGLKNGLWQPIDFKLASRDRAR